MVKLDDLDLNLLLSLRSLLTERSVTRAAAAMGVSQPAMSHSLRKLRELLDDPLFVRGGDGVVPTPRAEMMSRPLMAALQDLERTINGEHRQSFVPGESRRRFCLSMHDLMEHLLLPRLRLSLVEQAPGVDLLVRPLGERKLWESLESGAYDVAVGVAVGARIYTGHGDPPQGIQARKLLEESFLTVAREDHPALEDGVLDLDRFCALSHALISPQGDGESNVDHALRKMGRARRVALRLPSFAVAPLVAARTDLLLTMPRTLAEEYAEILPLQLFETPVELSSFSMLLLWHERFQEDAAHRWFRQMVVECCGG